MIDGRGYPGTDLSELLARIIGAAAQSPRYGIPTCDAAARTVDDGSYTMPAPTGAPYTKPVAVGPWTQSAAENIVTATSPASCSRAGSGCASPECA